MSKELVISATSHERRVAIVEEGQLVEIYIEREKEFALVGSIYKGKVTRVLPGMQSAFVDIGLDGDAFLYVSDVFENLEDYDHGHAHVEPAAVAAPLAAATRELLPGESLSSAGAEGVGVETHTIDLHEPEHASDAHEPSEHHNAEHDEHRQPAGLRNEAKAPERELSELDERQPESNASAPQNFAPNYNPTRNYPPRTGDRPQGGDRGNDRGGDNRGGDRGRGRRGRWGRRRSGSDRAGSGDRGGSSAPPQNHGGGRNLPPSKYASPQGDRDSRGFDNRRGPNDRGPERPERAERSPDRSPGIDRSHGPSAPVEKREDDIILPGESLAKYRARPVPPPVEPLGDHEPEERQPNFAEPPARPATSLPPGANPRRRFSGSLPHWLLADNETEAQAGESEASETNSSVTAAAESGNVVEERVHDSLHANLQEADLHEGDAHEESAPAEAMRDGAAGLSDEELNALATRLVEAKHEETQARAEADNLSGGPVFEEEDDEEELSGEAEHEEEQHAHEAEHSEQHAGGRFESSHTEDHDEEEHGEHSQHHESEHHHEEAQHDEERHEEHHDGDHQPSELVEASRSEHSESAIDHAESASYQAISAESGTSGSLPEEEAILLPGETRAPRDPNAPREEFVRRDSARIGSNPRSRFQRPQRGGRDRDRGRGGRPDGRRDRGDRGDRGERSPIASSPDRGPMRTGEPGPERGSDRGPERSHDRGPGRGPDRGPDRGGDRGRGRFQRGGHGQQRGHQGGHAPQRRPQLISEMLKAGQEIVVQIAKEPLGKKGARITSHVALPGRFLVYMPTIDHIGVSRKIDSAENRSRLRRLVGEARGSYPGGFIVRTAAGGATDDEIRTDIEFLGKTWNEIKQKNEERKPPALLHRDLNLVERILRDYVSDDFTGIWIDNEEEFGKVVEFVSRFQPKLVSRVKLYTKEQPIFEEFGIQHELDKALRAKVWLKSGGYIVINHTEALVAIDVNTGKFVGKGSVRLEDTIVKTNLEAVKEIVRQIRLRDLGGIIVVDFIDMEERRNREKVLGALQHALDQDKAPSKALSFNEFGLVCITRKRTKQALERVLCQPCPYCTGSGTVKSIPTLCYEIQSEARKMATAEHEGPNLTLRVHPEIAKALKTRESILIDELEQNSHKHIIIQSDATLHWEQYDIY